MAAAITQDDYLNDTAQFDVAKKKAAEQSAVALQARKDALARRFAALGNLESGARLKQEQIATDESEKNLGTANESIDAAQRSELGRRKEVVMGQQFAAGEAQKGREFAAEQAKGGQEFQAAQNELQRKFSTGERLSTQDFGALQAKLGREFTTSERQALQAYQSGERKAGQEFARGERLSGQEFAAGEAEKQRAVQAAQFEKTYGLSVEQFKAAKEQFEKTFGEEVRVNDANMGFAKDALDKKGFLEGIMDMPSNAGRGIAGAFKGAEGAVSSWF